MIIIRLVVMCLVLGFPHLDIVYGKHNRLYDQYDPLFVGRCEAHCWNIKNKYKCTKTCLTRGHLKPGRCPETNPESPFTSICLNTCSQDSQCPSITKCCKHQCGVTCQKPLNLDLARGVPDIPKNLSIHERRKKRSLQLKWISLNSTREPTIYVVEERYYSGQHFIENRMSEWAVCIRTLKPFAMLKRFIKPGRWYQFRVAAINENGTKGFSQISPNFITSVDPRPPRLPQNVTVGPLLQINGSLSAELHWKAPNSELPIDKYKVFWSKRLQGASVLDSVLVQQQTISKYHTKFLLQNLQPNSLYFLQIQALSQYGNDRLKGEKSGLLLNTSNYTNDNLRNSNNSNFIEGLRLQKIFWSQNELRARIIWKLKQGIKRYIISWWSSSCGHHNRNSNIMLAATTKNTYFDLYDIHFKCRYKVMVSEVSANDVISSQESSIIVTTPSCQYVQKHFEKLNC